MAVALIWLVSTVTSIITFLVLAQVVMTWLFYFNVLNARNNVIQQLFTTVNRLVEPMVRPLRRFLPNLGGVDLSPMALLLIVGFLRLLLLNTLSSFI